jgi:hypothetical protein
MATNTELEIQLIAVKKDIETLRGEVDKLKSASAEAVAEELKQTQEVLYQVFRVLGVASEWHHGMRKATEAKQIKAEEVASQINQTAPEPVSAIPTAADWQNISKELLGRPLMTLPEIQEMIQKDAATTAKG